MQLSADASSENLAEAIKDQTQSQRVQIIVNWARENKKQAKTTEILAKFATKGYYERTLALFAFAALRDTHNLFEALQSPSRSIQKYAARFIARDVSDEARIIAILPFVSISILQIMIGEFKRRRSITFNDQAFDVIMTHFGPKLAKNLLQGCSENTAKTFLPRFFSIIDNWKIFIQKWPELSTDVLLTQFFSSDVHPTRNQLHSQNKSQILFYLVKSLPDTKRMALLQKITQMSLHNDWSQFLKLCPKEWLSNIYQELKPKIFQELAENKYELLQKTLFTLESNHGSIFLSICSVQEQEILLEYGVKNLKDPYARHFLEFFPIQKRSAFLEKHFDQIRSQLLTPFSAFAIDTVVKFDSYFPITIKEWLAREFITQLKQIPNYLQLFGDKLLTACKFLPLDFNRDARDATRQNSNADIRESGYIHAIENLIIRYEDTISELYDNISPITTKRFSEEYSKRLPQYVLIFKAAERDLTTILEYCLNAGNDEKEIRFKIMDQLALVPMDLFHPCHFPIVRQIMANVLKDAESSPGRQEKSIRFAAGFLNAPLHPTYQAHYAFGVELFQFIRTYSARSELKLPSYVRWHKGNIGAIQPLLEKDHSLYSQIIDYSPTTSKCTPDLFYAFYQSPENRQRFVDMMVSYWGYLEDPAQFKLWRRFDRNWRSFIPAINAEHPEFVYIPHYRRILTFKDWTALPWSIFTNETYKSVKAPISEKIQWINLGQCVTQLPIAEQKMYQTYLGNEIKKELNSPDKKIGKILYRYITLPITQQIDLEPFLNNINSPFAGLVINYAPNMDDLFHMDTFLQKFLTTAQGSAAMQGIYTLAYHMPSFPIARILGGILTRNPLYSPSAGHVSDSIINKIRSQALTMLFSIPRIIPRVEFAPIIQTLLSDTKLTKIEIAMILNHLEVLIDYPEIFPFIQRILQVSPQILFNGLYYILPNRLPLVAQTKIIELIFENWNTAFLVEESFILIIPTWFLHHQTVITDKIWQYTTEFSDFANSVSTFNIIHMLFRTEIYQFFSPRILDLVQHYIKKLPHNPEVLKILFRIGEHLKNVDPEIKPTPQQFFEILPANANTPELWFLRLQYKINSIPLEHPQQMLGIIDAALTLLPTPRDPATFNFTSKMLENLYTRRFYSEFKSLLETETLTFPQLEVIAQWHTITEFPAVFMTKLQQWATDPNPQISHFVKDYLTYINWFETKGY